MKAKVHFSTKDGWSFQLRGRGACGSYRFEGDKAFGLNDFSIAFIFLSQNCWRAQEGRREFFS